jgi:hypothetical protein
MAKIGKKPTDDQMLEGGGGGGGFKSAASTTLTPRPTGSRSAKDYKEKEDKASDFSGEMGFKSPRSRNYDSGDRTPRMSDDYAKGGKVSSASSRADGCATKGKTKGRMI